MLAGGGGIASESVRKREGWLLRLHHSQPDLMELVPLPVNMFSAATQLSLPHADADMYGHIQK
jgi:hypothetical protein